MDLDTFVALLSELDGSDLDMIAKSLDAESVGDEVDSWHAMIAIDKELRRLHLSRNAAHAAYRASQAVLVAAGRQDWELPHPVATKVARAAADIARALTAGDGCRLELAFLVQPWNAIVLRTERVA
jgi:hypothetical protein